MMNQYTVLLADVGDERNVYLFHVESPTPRGAAIVAMSEHYQEQTLGWTQEDLELEPFSTDDYHLVGVMAGHQNWELVEL